MICCLILHCTKLSSSGVKSKKLETMVSTGMKLKDNSGFKSGLSWGLTPSRQQEVKREKN